MKNIKKMMESLITFFKIQNIEGDENVLVKIGNILETAKKLEKTYIDNNIHLF